MSVKGEGKGLWFGVAPSGPLEGLARGGRNSLREGAQVVE